MIYGSVCSGIEAATVAWHPLGWRPAWFSEIEPFPSAVLAHHYADVPNLGDMTTIARRILLGEIEAPDVLVGGTPCQAFSVAGLRNSLADERGNLSLRYVELADAIDHVRVARGDDPAVIVWENVPGVLSTDDNAFGCFLAGLAGEDEPLQPAGPRWSNAGAVYGPARAIAWRTMDAQYFGLAQRRRRVFVVASARRGFDPATVLFEWDRMRRDIAPRREAREAVAGTIGSGTGGGFRTTDLDGSGAFIVSNAEGSTGLPFLTVSNISKTVNNQTPLIAFSSKDYGADAGEIAPTLRAMNHSDSHANGGGQLAIAQASTVRRLTPRECERLQGFPDDYTLIPWRNKAPPDCPDSPRYKALGNSMAVPVMRWIGERINAVDAVLAEGINGR